MNITLKSAIALLLLTLSAPVQCAPDNSNMNDIAHKIIELPEPEVLVRGLDFSPDANRLAVQSAGGKINIWDWRHSRIETTLQRARGATGFTETNPILYSPDGRLLVACGSKALGNVVIQIWNTSGGSPVKDIVDDGPGGCDAAAFTPDGRFLLRGVYRVVRPSELIAYAVGTWVPEWSLQSRLALKSLAVSPDGKQVALAGVLTVVPPGDPPHSAAGLVRERTIDVLALPGRTPVRTIKSEAMGPLVWSPDGVRLALAGELYVEAFAAQTGQRLIHEQLQGAGNMHARYTPDGRYFIESDVNGRGTGLGVSIWDGQRQKLLQHISGDTANVAISRDSKLLALGRLNQVTVWELK